MEKKYNVVQIERARRREKVIQAWLGGKGLYVVMEGSEEKLKRSRWWDLKKRYQEGGFWALIDQRRGGKPQKVTEDIRKYIKEEKGYFPEITCGQLQGLIHHKFGKRISRVWLGRIVRETGQRLHRGRRQTGRRDYHKGIPIDNAGVYFLKGADSDMEGVKAIVEEIVRGRETEVPERSALERIRGTTPVTIKKKVETLLYLPMYDMQKPYHLLKYHKRGLGVVSGSGRRYSYYTADLFLGDIEKLKVAGKISERLARCYIEALCIEIELEDGSYFYIDGHAKHVWSSKNIPKAFFTTLQRAERGLHQYFIHSSKGNPLILLTCPGDTRLPGVIFNLIDAFENAVGKKIMKAAIFDREGLSLSIFEEFDERKKYFITLLRDNMYKGEDSFKLQSEYKPLKTEEKAGDVRVIEWVAEAEYELKDREKRRVVRVALVRKSVNEKIKLVPIITNITSKEEPEISKIARRYFERWPNQENIFKDAMEVLKVDTNHGYKKEEVQNRVAMRKKEELETNLRGITRRMEKAAREKEEAAKSLNTLQQVYGSRKGEYQREINELYAKIGLPISSDEERRKSLSRLKLLEKRQRELSEGYGEQMAQLEVKVKNKEQHLKSLTTQKKNKERDIESLDLERALYEIKTEKDQLMSNLKTLLINLSSYAQQQYFPEEFHSYTLESMKRTFYQQDGYVKVRKRKVEVTLQGYDDSSLQKAVEYACMKVNNSNIRTQEGQRIWMRVEGQNVQS